MATLRQKNTKPPRGWNYIQAETSLTIEGDSLDELTNRVIQHRQHRGLTPTDYKTVSLEIERQICTRLSRAECRSEGTTDSWVPVQDRLGIPNPMTVLQFSKAAI